jgi:hypothetical protein
LPSARKFGTCAIQVIRYLSAGFESAPPKIRCTAYLFAKNTYHELVLLVILFIYGTHTFWSWTAAGSWVNLKNPSFSPSR